MLNHWAGEGRLTADPNLQHTQNGTAVVTVSLAVERDYKAQDGTRGVDFIDVTAWRGSAEFLAKYFKKGDSVIVSGRIEVENYVDKDGNRRKSQKINADNVYFGGSKRRDQGDQSTAAEAAPGGDGEFPVLENDDGELPF